MTDVSDVPAHPPGALHESAHAKLNLRLRILAREASGLHQLETLFCRLALHDDVWVAPAAGATAGILLRVEGAELGAPEANLAHRAATLWCRRAGVAPACAIQLVKRIPAGAGLGGGSSDAAAVLRALDRLAAAGDAPGGAAPLGPDELLRLAAALGSDVPFFLAGGPLALAWGRGERLLPLPALPPATVVVAAPAAGMATAAAYARLAEARAAGAAPAAAPEPARLDLEALATWRGVAAMATNDFEPLVLARVPAAARALAVLREAGAAPALLTGSGSAVFGVFAAGEGQPAAARAAATAAARAVEADVPDARVFVTSPA